MKKLKHLFYVVAILLLFSSCNGATDKDKCLTSVQEMFPTADVYAPHKGTNVSFIVIENDIVYRVSTSSLTSAEVTNVTQYVKQ